MSQRVEKEDGGWVLPEFCLVGTRGSPLSECHRVVVASAPGAGYVPEDSGYRQRRGMKLFPVCDCFPTPDISDLLKGVGFFFEGVGAGCGF